MNKFNLIAVFCFCLFLFAAGINMLSDGAFFAGGFILLFGLGLLIYVFISVFTHSDTKSGDPVVRSNSKIIDDYFAGCVLYYFNKIQKEDLRKGFFVGYGRGLIADDLDSVDLEFDKKGGLHVGNSHQYEAGFNLGYIYAMDNVKPVFRIVMLQNSNRIELMDDCVCSKRDPINDDHLGQTHGHDGYMCLNCGGFYID